MNFNFVLFDKKGKEFFHNKMGINTATEMYLPYLF